MNLEPLHVEKYRENLLKQVTDIPNGMPLKLVLQMLFLISNQLSALTEAVVNNQPANMLDRETKRKGKR